jgi:glycosyltransferase involved in cell wall biosynthesis
MKISCVLITLNEESNLARCLESTSGLVDEIVVVDSGSRDATAEIARRFGARWIHQDWLGYVGQRNLAISEARHGWILVLDADEELSPRLRGELQRLRTEGPPADVDGFSMPRCVRYEGRWIRHGDWYPDRLTRLFRSGAARYTGAKVHERLEIAGRVLPLGGDLHHYSFRDEEDHRARARHYARLWAESRWEAGRRCGAWAPILHGAFRWVRGYLLKAGFLDGVQGWRVARISAWETHLKYRLLRSQGSAPRPPSAG